MKRFVLIAAFAVALLGGIGDALASTVNINFSGTISGGGGSINGNLVLDMPNPPSVTPQGSGFYVLYTGTGTVNAGAVSLTDTALIENSVQPGFGGLRFSIGGGAFELLFEAMGGSPGPLLSLADLPADKAGIFAYLGPFVMSERGSLNGTNFTVDSFSVSQTPIPAALPLLASALGGLGLVGWRRRRAVAA